MPPPIFPSFDSAPTSTSVPETVIVPRLRDLGNGFEVRRVLPAQERRMVGPFVFFDHIGPTVLRRGSGLDIAPHPHIGLATVTYLFAGEILHRDSLGSVQPIRPGEVNWMIAGRGIVHSERTPQELRASDTELFGIQTWVGLPRAQEETAPAFSHYGADELPLLDGQGIRLRVIAGEIYGKRAPVSVFSAMFYADAALDRGARLDLPPTYEERAIYVASGRIEIAGEAYDSDRLLMLRKNETVTMSATASSRLVLLGGEPLDGPRHIWWNFVASSRARIEEAKADWKEGRFAAVPGETGFIPLPG